MRVIQDAAALIAWRKCITGRVGFVPTMGYLHRGHTSLIDQTRVDADQVVVSIYVNPLQFGPQEDLGIYPRDTEGDLAKCEAHGTDLVFMPDTLYPADFRTRVQVSELTTSLCGASRPILFDGVTTVVARLFGLVKPDFAVFGEKDYQQLLVVRRMAEDLALGVEVRSGPLVRDDDGVALSSRNRYLSPAERTRARSLSRALAAMQKCRFADVEHLKAITADILDVDALDYLEVVDATNLTPLQAVDRPARALVAAWVGRTRLIDNVALEPRRV